MTQITYALRLKFAIGSLLILPFVCTLADDWPKDYKALQDLLW
jgi:hypothetical protein